MRRNSFDINADILRIALGGVRLTHLVYRGNLNFKQVKGYLQRLTEARCITLIDGVYVTTPQGEEYIRRYNDLKTPNYYPTLAV